MNKSTEQRYPSGPAKIGEQKPGGKSSGQPHNKATTVLPRDGSQGPGKAVRQEQPNPDQAFTKAKLKQESKKP